MSFFRLLRPFAEVWTFALLGKRKQLEDRQETNTVLNWDHDKK